MVLAYKQLSLMKVTLMARIGLHAHANGESAVLTQMVFVCRLLVCCS